MRPLILGIMLVISPLSVLAESPPVHWEVVQQSGGPADGAQQWLRFLGRISPASLRIRQAKSGDQPNVERRPFPGGESYFVTAVLTRRNQLRVPGRELNYGDIEALQAWVASLPTQTAGSDSGAQDAVAFGLSSSQLVELVRALGKPVLERTRGQSVRTVVQHIRALIPNAVMLDAAARDAMTDAGPVQDELRGVSAGTALAAVVRPLGLAVVPEALGADRILLRIRRAQGADEVWPVGWPNEGRDHDAVPKLMEKLPVEIVEMPLSKVLAALQPRLDVPILMDHNGLAAQAIDPDEVKVSYPSGRTFYKRVLDRVLFQARLELDVRLDEAQRPVIWIRPIRRSSESL